jgi:cellulose biosynthesis protein BcsQ
VTIDCPPQLGFTTMTALLASTRFLRSIRLDQVLTTPMLKSTAISNAGMTQQTIYELDPSQVVKKTLERIL